MGLRPLYLVFFLLVLSLSVGCGFLGFGGDEEVGDLGLIEFEDDGSSLPDEPQEAARRSLYIPPEVLVEIRFLHNLQVRMEGLRQVIRDLLSASEYSGPSDVNLDWVIEVHEVTRESDEFFKVLASVDIPGSQRAQYDYLYVGMLEIVQISGYGSDRLLAASVLVGPSGRSMVNMTSEEIDEFETLVREAGFFLNDADARVKARLKEMGRAVGGLGLR